MVKEALQSCAPLKVETGIETKSKHNQKYSNEDGSRHPGTAKIRNKSTERKVFIL